MKAILTEDGQQRLDVTKPEIKAIEKVVPKLRFAARVLDMAEQFEAFMALANAVTKQGDDELLPGDPSREGPVEVGDAVADRDMPYLPGMEPPL